MAVILLAWSRRARQPGPGRNYPPKDRVPNRLSLAQLRELAAAAGMAQADIGAAIAMAESGGRTDAVGDGGDSIGLWQIHVPTCPKQWAIKDALKHAGFNAQAATSMSAGGTSWTLWTTYKTGAYRKYLPSAP